MQLPYYVADILSRFPLSWIEFFHLLFVCIYFLVSLIVIGKYDSSQ